MVSTGHSSRWLNETGLSNNPDTTTCASFEVDRFTHTLGIFSRRFRRIFEKLGNTETRFFQDRLEAIQLNRPVFITGLARAGSTLLLEYCAAHDDASTHRYRDFPFLLTPLWWNRFLDAVPRRVQRQVERAHRDGLMMTAESPEAMEEMVWMAFYPHAHDPLLSQVLGGSTAHKKYEHFYQNHIRKILFIRNGKRYICKNNYNTTRLAYLLRLFPDCRFVIPVRNPLTHVASMIKQHRLFCKAQKQYPRALDYLRCAGHFEFGLDRRPIHTGNDTTVRSIVSLWECGEEVRGWARYWALVYGHIADTLERDQALKKASLLVRFEDLCAHPRERLKTVSSHCMLQINQLKQERFMRRIRYPDYYDAGFSDQEQRVITDETKDVARRFGYGEV